MVKSPFSYGFPMVFLFLFFFVRTPKSVRWRLRISSTAGITSSWWDAVDRLVCSARGLTAGSLIYIYIYTAYKYIYIYIYTAYTYIYIYIYDSTPIKKKSSSLLVVLFVRRYRNRYLTHHGDLTMFQT